MNERPVGPATSRAVRVLWWIVAAGGVALCAVGWKVYDAWRRYESFAPGVAESVLLPGHAELVACAAGLAVVDPEASDLEEFGLRYGGSDSGAGDPRLSSFGRSLSGEGSAARPTWVARVVVGDPDLVARTGRRRAWAAGLTQRVDSDFTCGDACELVRLHRGGEECGFAVELRLHVQDERVWSVAVVGSPLSDPTALRALLDRVSAALVRYHPG